MLLALDVVVPSSGSFLRSLPSYAGEDSLDTSLVVRSTYIMSLQTPGIQSTSQESSRRSAAFMPSLGFEGFREATELLPLCSSVKGKLVISDMLVLG